MADRLVITALQRWAPRDVVGRVFGIVYSLSIVGIFVGSFVTAGAVALGGLTTGLIVFGAAPGIVALWLLRGLHAMDRDAAVRLEELRPAIETLGKLGISPRRLVRFSRLLRPRPNESSSPPGPR